MVNAWKIHTCEHVSASGDCKGSVVIKVVLNILTTVIFFIKIINVWLKTAEKDSVILFYIDVFDIIVITNTVNGGVSFAGCIFYGAAGQFDFCIYSFYSVAIFFGRNDGAALNSYVTLRILVAFGHVGLNYGILIRLDDTARHDQLVSVMQNDLVKNLSAGYIDFERRIIVTCIVNAFLNGSALYI